MVTVLVHARKCTFSMTKTTISNTICWLWLSSILVVFHFSHLPFWSFNDLLRNWFKSIKDHLECGLKLLTSRHYCLSNVFPYLDDSLTCGVRSRSQESESGVGVRARSQSQESGAGLRIIFEKVLSMKVENFLKLMKLAPDDPKCLDMSQDNICEVF